LACAAASDLLPSFAVSFSSLRLSTFWNCRFGRRTSCGHFATRARSCKSAACRTVKIVSPGGLDLANVLTLMALGATCPGMLAKTVSPSVHCQAGGCTRTPARHKERFARCASLALRHLNADVKDLRQVRPGPKHAAVQGPSPLKRPTSGRRRRCCLRHPVLPSRRFRGRLS
jgi:hypothetical protein